MLAGATYPLAAWLGDTEHFPTTSFNTADRAYNMPCATEEDFEKTVVSLRALCATWGFQINEVAGPM